MSSLFLFLLISAPARAIETRPADIQKDLKGPAVQGEVTSSAFAFDERRLAPATDDTAPDGAVLCAGQKPFNNNYCDCGDDCVERLDKYCFCEEARKCCGEKTTCVDSPSSKWKYDAGDKGMKGCSHIAGGTKKERKKRCKREGSNGATGNEACPKACGKCKDDGPPPRPRPTPTPTSTPRCDGDPVPDKKGYKAPGPFVVTWHVRDHAEGMGFETKKEAEKCFEKYEDSGSWATRLYDKDLEILDEYGGMSKDNWKMLKKWAKNFIGDSKTIEDDDSKCKGEKGKDDSKWYYKKEANDCAWAKKKGKCHKTGGTDGKGRTRSGYESCCKSCKS